MAGNPSRHHAAGRASPHCFPPLLFFPVLLHWKKQDPTTCFHANYILLYHKLFQLQARVWVGVLTAGEAEVLFNLC